jgi:aspartate-semialdehyde dehydrogenase
MCLKNSKLNYTQRVFILIQTCNKPFLTSVQKKTAIIKKLNNCVTLLAKPTKKVLHENKLKLLI